MFDGWCEGCRGKSFEFDPCQNDDHYTWCSDCRRDYHCDLTCEEDREDALANPEDRAAEGGGE